MDNGRNMYVGTALDLPPDVKDSITYLFKEIGQTPSDVKLPILAGPNEIIQIALDSKFLHYLVPWALNGLLPSVLGSFLYDKYKNRVDPKHDDLSLRIIDIMQKVEGITADISKIGYRIDTFLDRATYSNPPYSKGWEPTFAIRNSSIHGSREIVQMPAYIKNAFGNSVPDKNSAAIAVLCLNILAPEIEAISREFLPEGNEEACMREYRTIEGCPEIKDNGTISVLLRMSKKVEGPKMVDVKYVEIKFDSDGSLKVEDRSDLVN